jgi:hypothetical protein
MAKVLLHVPMQVCQYHYNGVLHSVYIYMKSQDNLRIA